MIRLLRVTLPLLFCCLLGFVPANAQDPKLQPLLDGKMKEITNAFINGDLTPVLDLFSPTMMIIEPDGSTSRRADIVQAVKSGALKYTSVKISDEKFADFGDVAILTYVSTESGTARGQDISGKYRYSHVWAHQSGRWTLITTQITLAVPQTQ